MSTVLKSIVVVISLLFSGHVLADPVKDRLGGTLTFTASNNYIVVDESGTQVCNHTSASWVCTVERGKYRWRDLTESTEGFFYSLADNEAGPVPSQITEPAGSILSTPSFGSAVSLAQVQAMIDALTIPDNSAIDARIQTIVDSLTIPDDAQIDARALAVFNATCEVVE